MPANTRSPAMVLPELMQELDFLGQVIDARKELRRLGKTCEALSLCYRGLGICSLSGDGDTVTFLHYLIQSALTRRHYLSGAGQAAESVYRRASLLNPVLDAMAARQWRLATEITALAAQQWSEGDEYEDDFCYAAVVRELLNGRDASLPPLLARWEEVLEGGSDQRLDIMRALIAQDAGAFADCLTALLEARDAKLAEEAEDLYEPSVFPERWVCVEGLALLALAERRGLTVPGEFLACPPIAREAEATAFRPRGFPHVPYTNE